MANTNRKSSDSRGNGIGAAIAIALGVAVAGCASSGLTDATRQDVSAKMTTIQAPVATCYEQALKRNRKLRGNMTVAFSAKRDTGKFSEIKVTRNDLPDPELEACVREQVGALALSQPTSVDVTIEYPLNFTPLD
jgi:hypothetical protein